MEWVILGVVGALIGVLFHVFARSLRMPQMLCMILGATGAILGGILVYFTGIEAFGYGSFYITGVLLAIGLLAGGALGYSLTNRDENRV